MCRWLKTPQDVANSLDVEFNNDVVEKFSIVETIEIFIGDSDASNSRWWWICEQPVDTHTHTHTYTQVFLIRMLYN